MFNRHIKKLTPIQINWIAGACVVFYLIPAFLEFRFSFNDELFTFLKEVAVAIALYVTVWGILPLRNEIEKLLHHIILPPLVIASREDDQYVKEIREYFSRIDTDFEDKMKELPRLLKFCGIEDVALSKKIEDCVENVGNQDCNNKDITRYYEILHNQIRNCQVIIILFYNNTSRAWLTNRINLYKRIQAETKEQVLSKVILCTNETKTNIESLLGENTNEIVIIDGTFNVETLASRINTKLARKRS